jgi:O-antigen/teichoic acid export membrane protein
MLRLRSRFLTNIVQTVGTRFSLLAIGMISSAVIARAIGPDGRGRYAAATAFGALLCQIANLGLPSTNTRVIAMDRAAAGRMWTTSIASGLAASGLLVAASLGTRFVLGTSAMPTDDSLLRFVFVRLPLDLAYVLTLAVVVGLQEIRLYNVAELVTRCLVTSGFLALWLLHVLTVETVYAVDTAGILLALSFVFFRLRASGVRDLTFDLDLIRRQWRYGIKAYAALMFSFLGAKGTFLIVNRFVSHADLGYLSLASTLSDMVLVVPVVVSTLLFPKLAANTDLAARWRETRRVAWLMAAGLSTLLVMFDLAAPFAIQIVYGSRFLPSAGLFTRLSPGIVAMATNSVLMQYFASLGMPKAISVASPAIGGLVNTTLCFALAPTFGVPGAAYASSIANCATLLYTCVFVAYTGQSHQATSLPQ